MRWQRKFRGDGNRREERNRGSYCLACFEGIPAGGHVVCGMCGFHNRQVDRRERWTLAPRIVRFEKILKVLIVVVFFMVYPAAVYSARGGFGVGGGWYFATALMSVSVFWRTASAMTHHQYGFEASLVWKLFFVTTGTFFAVAASGDSGGRALAAAIASFAGFALVNLTTASFVCWKRRLITSRFQVR